MNLENTVKYHFAKSTMISDAPRATASDSLTGTDIMAAIGMTQSRAALGFSAFLGKMDISDYDRERAIDLLTKYAIEHCDKVAALRKLNSDVKPKVMQVLAAFAFADYSRSAASTRTCDCCHGNKFVEAEVMTMKHIGRPHLSEKRETVKVLCHKCKGKGVLTNACQCNGKGTVLDKEKTILQRGVPAYKTCSRCNGRGYARLLPDSVRKYICVTVMDIPETTWRRSYKDFFESLVGECIKQEEYANQMLNKVTR
ncbi:antitermination protein [Citrobacter portucalensis]|uniref:antitermination protein n=1 Tax=Citrobacter portucalensis TaxID=1639133 RepID=UPI0017836862|nr:antitermination protein [Citrobacter portucalensis]MBD9984581.1 antitermination protein [Citrobacter portucalensis]MBE0031841.1 antitermination protein [Citrobacter portucalensis]MBE0039862.1 antitermination protein [Citrobacter portucalensis]MBE0046816.1 antitermination protein [Citrobacter portucalensis]MBE0076437.1 antitermination protein [Citrobacter portucalensis]